MSGNEVQSIRMSETQNDPREPSNSPQHVHDNQKSLALEKAIHDAHARLNRPCQKEIEILQQRGAFYLPPEAVCDELVSAYFKWVAAIIPVVNRSQFMQKYNDPDDLPSLLLLQAILMAGSQVCNTHKSMDPKVSILYDASSYHTRAKALYDSNYEGDKAIVVQALVLMGWYCEGSEGRR
jgi:hypothetical protein